MHLWIYSNCCPKLVAMVRPFVPSFREEMHSPMALMQSENQTLHGYVAYIWSYGHFCDFLAYFGQNVVAAATSLGSLQSKNVFLGLATTKNRAIGNRFLDISRRNAFICIYSNFCPQSGCHGNTPLSLVHGSVRDEFPECTIAICKPNFAWICDLHMELWSFLWLVGLFWRKFGCHGNVP